MLVNLSVKADNRPKTTCLFTFKDYKVLKVFTIVIRIEGDLKKSILYALIP